MPDLDATQLASGDETLCAIRTNGRVACWGFRGHLLAGDGQTVTPVDVEGLEHVTRLVLARMFGCVLDASAQAKCWGEDSLTRPMPRGGSADVPAPVTVADWAGACDLSAGQDHACVVTADRAVSCIGFTGLREEREVVGPRNAPFRAHGLPGRAAQIFASGNETCVHLEDGAMWCWGSDDYDQLRGEDPENCRVDQLHLTVTPCVSAPQPFELGY